jgi:hypothetical protein
VSRVIRKRVVLIGAAAAALAAAGIAYATIPDANGVYTACKLNVTGTIRLIDPSLGNTSLLGHCTSLEAQITWNQKGQQGPAGPQGPTGDTGAQGPAGPAGVSGYEVDTVNANSAASGKSVGDAMSAILVCPSGKKVLGGGESGDWGIASAAPSSDGTTWTVSGTVQPDSFAGLEIWAVCATA